MPKHVSTGLLFGDPDAIPVPDLDRTDYLLMLGANPYESNGSLCTAPDFPGRLEAIQARGGRRRRRRPPAHPTAEEADEHVAIRPGTDAYLLLAMIHVAASPRASPTSARLAEHSDGRRRAAATLSPRSPPRPSPPSPASTPTTSAASPASSPPRRPPRRTAASAPTPSTFGTLAVVARRRAQRPHRQPRPAGRRHVPPRRAPRRRGPEGGGRGFTIGRWHQPGARAARRSAASCRSPSLAEEIETPGEGQIRALITVAGNPVLSTPNGDRLDAALADLEFMVIVDPYLNETTRHADVILPPPIPPRAAATTTWPSTASRCATSPTTPRRSAATRTPRRVRDPGPAGADRRRQGASADPAIVDDLLVDGAAAARRADRARLPVAGRDPAEHPRRRSAASTRRGAPARPHVRTGPYGDGFGADPDGLSLAKLRDNPHGIDLGPLRAPPARRCCKTTSGTVELLPEPHRPTSPAWRPPRGRPSTATMRARRPPPPALQQLVDAQRRRPGEGQGPLHAAGPPRRRRPPRPGRRRHGPGQSAGSGRLDAPVEVTDVDPPRRRSASPTAGATTGPASRWPSPRKRPGVNINLLTDGAELDPLSGNAVLNGIPVEVSAA